MLSLTTDDKGSNESENKISEVKHARRKDVLGFYCVFPNSTVFHVLVVLGHPFYGGALFQETIITSMASISQLVSEFAHSLGQPNNYALRENIKSLIIHTRNEVIRRSYENHNYVDKVLTQRYKVTLTMVNDGEVNLPDDVSFARIDKIFRTVQQVPRPVRLTNNLPFDRVSTVGYKTNREIPFIKETTARFRSAVPGLCGMPCYDYINGYIYIFPVDCKSFDLRKIVIESAFEHPTAIEIENGTADDYDAYFDNNEWLLSEDMIGQIKEIIYKRDLLNTVRQTNEIPNTIKYNS